MPSYSSLGGFLLLFLGLRLRRSRIAVLRGRLLARATAVVRRVEARALEVDGHRIEHALERPLAADLALLGLRVADLLEELEQGPVGAAVLVDRHRRSKNSWAAGCGRFRARASRGSTVRPRRPPGPAGSGAAGDAGGARRQARRTHPAARRSRTSAGAPTV